MTYALAQIRTNQIEEHLLYMSIVYAFQNESEFVNLIFPESKLP